MTGVRGGERSRARRNDRRCKELVEENKWLKKRIAYLNSELVKERAISDELATNYPLPSSGREDEN